MKSKENYTGFKGIAKFIANVVSWTALVILVLLALFLAYYTINTKLYASKGEKFEPFVSLYTIVSGSMEPNIKVGDVIVSKKVKSPTEIKVGDVITFTSTSSISRGMIVTHRVVEVYKNENGYSYKTKGDNNLSPDTAPAEYNNVLGKVILRVPKLGKVQNFLGTQGGWLIVIVIPALLIIISDILKIFKLTGVKNKIEKMNKEQISLKDKRAEKEKARKEILKKKLGLLEKSPYEPDPIITQKMTKVVVGSKPTKTKRFVTKEEGAYTDTSELSRVSRMSRRNRNRRRQRNANRNKR